MLQGHVDVLHQCRVLRQGIQEFLRDAVGIAVEKANPLGMRRVDLRQSRHELRQPILNSEIFSVRSGGLADQIDLAYSLPKKAGRFGDYRFEPPATKLAAVLRNDAKRAGMIATFRDFDVSIMSRRSQNAGRQIMVEVRLASVAFGMLPLAQCND